MKRSIKVSGLCLALAIVICLSWLSAWGAQSTSTTAKATTFASTSADAQKGLITYISFGGMSIFRFRTFLMAIRC